MTEPAREMLSDELVEAMENLHLYPRLIAERAAREAVNAALDALAAKVEGLPVGKVRGEHIEGSMFVDFDETEEVIERSAVLALIAEAKAYRGDEG